MIIPILVVIFNIFLLMYLQISLTAARDSLLLWFNTVLPRLLPLFVTRNILILLSFVDFIAALRSPLVRKIFRLLEAAKFGLVAGIISSYPDGVKMATDLKQTKRLSTKEAQHLFFFLQQ